MSLVPRRAASGAAVAAGAFLLLVGVTGPLPYPIYARMVPRTPTDYLFLVLTAALLGVYAAQRVPADDRHDGNRAAAMREAFAEYIARYGDGDASDQLPSDPQLATAYQTLRQRADPDHGRIPTDEAIPAVAEATKLPRPAVKRRVFEPLRERGWIDPRYSVLIVYEQPRGEA